MVVLTATVAGTAPLHFSWTFNEVPIPNAHGPTLAISNVQPANSGLYHLTVTNEYGSITSSNVSLNVTGSGNDGTLTFANSLLNQVLAANGSGVPVGQGFLAVLFAGADSNSLTSVGSAASFVVPGAFYGGTRSIPSVPPGGVAYLQVRVWDSKVSGTYEEAAALGAEHGESSVFSGILGGGLLPPTPLMMPGFALVPASAAAKARVVRRTPSQSTTLHNFIRAEDAVRFTIRGLANTTYAIESSDDLQTWELVDYAINNSGVIEVVDRNPATERRFYRVRTILP